MLPIGMLQEGDEQLDGGGRGDRREPRTSDSAHLVKCSVCKGLECRVLNGKNAGQG